MYPWEEFGLAIVRAMQTLSPWLDAPMQVLSFLGRIEFYLLFIPLIYWNVSPALALRLLMLLTAVDTFGAAAKQWLHQPRPYWFGEVKALAEEPTFGIPSSHASNSLAAFGLLAGQVRQRWAWAIGGALIVLIGLSRVYLGVHFPHDIFGGWLLGAAVLLLFVRFEGRATALLGRQSGGMQALIGLLASVLIVSVGLVTVGLAGAGPYPAAWASYATEPRSPAHFFTLGGTVLGAVTSYLAMRRYAAFKVSGTTWQLVLRYALGIAGLVVVWRGLDIVFGLAAADETPAGYGLRYVRYAATTGWAMFGAPWVFLKSRLATAATASATPLQPARKLPAT